MLTRFFLFIFLINISYANITLVSGNRGGAYEQIAKNIKEILETNSSYKIDIKYSKGSIDNFKFLQNRKFDLALMQGDALFLESNRAKLETYNVLPIAKVANENIFILTYHSDINSVSNLIYKSINVGTIGSGLNESANILFKSIDIIDNINMTHFNVNKSLNLLKSHKIDAILINKIDKNLKQLIENKKLFMVHIPMDVITKLHQTFPYFYRIKYKLNNFLSVSTISIPTMLVARDNLDNKIVFDIVKMLDKNSTKKILKVDDIFSVNPINAWHEGVEKYAKESGKKLYYYDENYVYLVYLEIAILVGALLFALITLIIIHNSYIFHKYDFTNNIIENSQRLYKIIIKNKYKSLFIILMLVYILSALLIKYFEHKWALEEETFSNFDSFSFFKIFTWLFVFGSTGYEDTIFPSSPSAKIVSAFTPFIGIGSILAMGGFYIFDRVKSYLLETKGMSSKKVKNHIILVGWRENAKSIVNSLIHKNLLNKSQIVILAPNDKAIEEIKNSNFNSLYISYVRGKGQNTQDLQRANIKDAKTIIVIQNAEDSGDAENILTILTIKKYEEYLLKEKIRKEKLYTIVEINNKENIQLAYDAGADQVVNLENINAKIFTQAILNPGVAKFIHEIITFNDDNDIYSFVAKKDNPLIGKTFDEILVILRKYKILLVSINIGYKKSLKEKEKIIKHYGFKDEVIIPTLR